MRQFINTIYSLFFALFFLQSCRDSIYNQAENWSIEVKRKILEDANVTPDKTIIDTSINNLAIFKGNKKLKFYHLIPILDDNLKVIFF